MARRDHAFPPPGTAPSLVVTARNMDLAGADRQRAAGEHDVGVGDVTVPPLPLPPPQPNKKIAEMRRPNAIVNLMHSA